MTTSPDKAITAAHAEKEVLEFLTARTKQSWDPDTDLFADGGVSSLFAMELVMFLEEAFGIVIAGADLRLDNFRTVRRMVELVRRLSTNDLVHGG